ncbi:unnamed protein product [Phytophthora fragariaefolia]|uniref:Unnamed protein product n=1 Tax=Phytophthora fragariaefolia TaxID=1490495 RepID=A0A9W6XSN6_9STRA|nr:unnamed protein product [Phytophthora fragariaefolia]
MVERQVLIDLGFSVYNVAQHPHKFVLYYVKVLDGSPQLAQQAWGYINDSLRADLCVRYSAQVIACAAIFLASRFQRVALPERPPWYALFGVDKPQLYAVSVAIMELYKQEKLEWLEPLTDTNPFAVDDQPGEEEEDGSEQGGHHADAKAAAHAEKEVSPQGPVSTASAEATTATNDASSEAKTSASPADAKSSERRSRWDNAQTKSRRGRNENILVEKEIVLAAIESAVVVDRLTDPGAVEAEDAVVTVAVEVAVLIAIGVELECCSARRLRQRKAKIQRFCL